jgi:hypothetical protein
MKKFLKAFRTRSLFAALLVAAIVAIFVPQAAASAESVTVRQGLTLSPTSSSPTIDPGATNDSSMNLLNDGDSDIAVRIYASPYHVEGDNYDPQFTPLPGTTDASKWVNLPTNLASIPAHKLISVPYSVTVPAGTTPGGYYAVVFSETQPSANKGVTPRSRVGNILYITVAGPVKEGGSVVNASLSHFSTASKLPLSLKVSNTGGLHFLTTADITVTNLFGRTVFQDKLQRYVLPQTVRTITGTWKTAPLGLYHVSRTATVNGKSQSLPKQWILVVHPWVIAAAILLVIILIAICILPSLSYGRKKRKAKRR